METEAGELDNQDSAAELAYRNIYRMMLMHGLWRHIREVRLTTADRIFFEAHHTMEQALDVATAHGHWTKSASSGGPHRLVRQLYRGFPRWERSVSWRSLTRPSLQITLARAHRDSWHWFGDADVDHGNPLMDVLGALVHLVEVLNPGKTDHRKLEGKIARQYEEWERNRGEARPS